MQHGRIDLGILERLRVTVRTGAAPRYGFRRKHKVLISKFASATPWRLKSKSEMPRLRLEPDRPGAGHAARFLGAGVARAVCSHQLAARTGGGTQDQTFIELKSRVLIFLLF